MSALRWICKSREALSDPDRNAQFENINETVGKFQQCSQPVIYVTDNGLNQD
jgi:hypothetical protein